MPPATDDTSYNSRCNSDCQNHTEKDAKSPSSHTASPFFRFWGCNRVFRPSGAGTICGGCRRLGRSLPAADLGALGKIGFFIAVALEWIEILVCIVHSTCVELETFIITRVDRRLPWQSDRPFDVQYERCKYLLRRMSCHLILSRSAVDSSKVGAK